MTQLMGNNLPSNRKDALAVGATRYFTGKLCKHGHTSPRYAGDGSCAECGRLKLKAYQWHARNGAVNRAKVAAWKMENPGRAAAATRRWYEANRAQVITNAAKRKKANPDIGTVQEAARRAAKALRFPPWSDRKIIREIYRNCPTGWHVDHIFPLRGKLISGLHVPLNLQHIPAENNRSKHNYFTPVWPNPDFAADLQRAREGLVAFKQQA